MSANSKIEWTDATWNPIRARNLKTGKIGWHCEHATTGCEHCYSEGFNKRLGTGLPFKPGHRSDIELFLDEEMLTLPLRWKKPRMIFVCSMTDLFADLVKDEWIDKLFAVMALCPQHTFQVLTKRAERMRDYCAQHVGVWCPDFGSKKPPLLSEEILLDSRVGREGPLLNVWLGVSCERQREADERIPDLLRTPAAIRFISAEPLLGPINLDIIRARFWARGQCMNVLTGSHNPSLTGMAPDATLDWVIVGGESGRNARPMHPQWARDLRDQCAAAGVAFFFKQWGEWAPGETYPIADAATDMPLGTLEDNRDGKLFYAGLGRLSICLRRVGKKAAGRRLDGVEYNGMPEVGT